MGGGPSLPSFPRKRESGSGLPGMQRHKAVPFGIPAYAGMTVGQPVERNGAADGIRTHDPLLGKEMLYH